MKKVWFVSLILGWMFITSCAGIKTQLLSEQLQTYHQSLRWGNLPTMSVFFSPTTQKELAEHYAKKFRTEKITDFAVVQSNLSPDQKQAQTLIQYTFIDEATQNVSQAQTLEVWEYHAKQEQWKLVSVKDLK